MTNPDPRVEIILGRIRRAMQRSIKGLEGAKLDNITQKEVTRRLTRVMMHAERLGWIAADG